jgi:dTDP-4-dehydrorhamnose reductase
MKKTILIFGVSSFVGSNLVELLKDDFRIIGTYFKTPVAISGMTCIPCDVLKKEYVSSLVAHFRPDIVIYSVGVSSLRKSQSFSKLSDSLNSSGAVNCLTATDRFNAKFIYFSSAFVLSGNDNYPREGETPLPTNAYGLSLSSTEFYIQRSCLNYVILRCSDLYGRSYHPQRNHWFEYLEHALAKGERISVDDTVHTGFLDIQIMVKILKVILVKNVSNRLLHVSSKDFMTRYDFAKIYAKTFKKDESLIVKGSSHFPGISDVTSEASKLYFRLDTTNLEELLNTTLPTVEESIAVTFKKLHQLV